MTGFEYSYAGLLISEGMIEEGLEAVRAIRNRYDGKKRNPWNEIECGSNYARPMASFALLPIFSGFSYDLPHGHIGFAPITQGDFRCLWSLGTGWGEYIKTSDMQKIVLHDGSLTISEVRLSNGFHVNTIIADGKEIPFTQDGDLIRFASVTVCSMLTFEASK